MSIAILRTANRDGSGRTGKGFVGRGRTAPCLYTVARETLGAVPSPSVSLEPSLTSAPITKFLQLSIKLTCARGGDDSGGKDEVIAC